MRGEMRQLTLSLAVGINPTFDNFLPNHSMQAWEYLQIYPLPSGPIYLWGPRGSGKSHLLAALAVSLQEKGLSVLFFSSRNLQPCIFDASSNYGAIMFDDCDKFSKAQQYEAFALFEKAHSFNIPIISTALVPPIDLSIREDLRSRLGWGVVFQLDVLNDDEMRAVLRFQAENKGLILPDETLDYLLYHFQRDLTALSYLIERLDTYSLSLKKKILTVSLMKKMISEDCTFL
jgi:DnaA family protein